MHPRSLLAVVVALPGLWSCGREAAAAPAPPDLVRRGAYLVAYGGCNDCHTPKLPGPEGLPDTLRALSGHPAGATTPAVPAGLLSDTGWATAATGDLTAWAGPWGVAFAANLTPDATGLAEWTEETFIATMRTGKHLGVGRPILPPMPWQGLAGLTDDDLKALFAYLRTVKAVHNEVPGPVPPAGGR
jgi:mono/diheme cytochrome c family protein